MNCLFCDIVNGKKDFFKIWEDDLFLAFLDINPINPGHTLLIPKKHYAEVFEMDEDAYKKIFSTAKFLAIKLKKIIDTPKIGLAIEGFGVDHVHIHLVPVYSGNELNPERAKPASLEDLESMKIKITSSLK